MKDYVRVSLETHLFFARIMKEHSLFLQAGFVQKDMDWIRRADFFRRQFEELLKITVQMSNRRVSKFVLDSNELVTKYTIDAEQKTSELSGLPIDRRITAIQREMKCGHDFQVDRDDVQTIHRLNERAVMLLNGLIEFKENVLRNVENCSMFTANYPLLIHHITKEAKLYRETIEGLMKNQKVCYRNLQNQEEFWNCIMMEHALFIRGLLDPCESDLIMKADGFVYDFQELLTEARKQEGKARECECCDNNEQKCKGLDNDSLTTTRQIRDFKAAGTDGLIHCKIKSIMLPLLADHVLREANHYIRIMEHGYQWQEG